MRVQLGDLIMSVKDLKNKRQKRNRKQRKELDRDLHFINQREEVMAEQMGIYDWKGW